MKKYYFETYRFSEDLDFTLREQIHINEATLKEQFTSVAEWLYEETGIDIPSDRLVKGTTQTTAQKFSQKCEFSHIFANFFLFNRRRAARLYLRGYTDHGT